MQTYVARVPEPRELAEALKADVLVPYGEKVENRTVEKIFHASQSP